MTTNPHETDPMAEMAAAAAAGMTVDAYRAKQARQAKRDAAHDDYQASVHRMFAPTMEPDNDTGPTFDTSDD